MRAARLGIALLAASALGWPAEGAIITLVSGDDDGTGWHDETPVGRVTGNAGLTIGDQRLRVFEAVAAELGKRIVSDVEIKVLGGWRELPCDPTGGVLGGAGPSNFVANSRNVIRRDTWYPQALAEALAGGSVGLEDEPIVMIFNPDIGAPDCISAGRWDHRIGVFIPQTNRISLYDTIMHEILHGLGFLDTVMADGTRLMNRNDVYMLNLEDHSLGRKWPALTDAQRAASRVDAGDLDWTGGNVGLHSADLVGGRQDGSSHVRIYAPSLATESSVSHWDTALLSGFDELMEPFSTQRQEPFLTPYLLQDIGWSLNHPDVVALKDVNGSGWTDLAVLRVGTSPAGHRVRVFDPQDNTLISEAQLPSDVTALALAAVPGFGAEETSQLAVLTWTARSRRVRVFIYDALSAVLVDIVEFPIGFPKSMIVLPSYFGTAAAEIAVLGANPAGGARVWIRDAMSNRIVANLVLPKWIPGAITYLPDSGFSSAPEIVVTLTDPTTGKSFMRTRDGRTGRLFHETQLVDDFIPSFATMVSDFGGSPTPEAVFAGINRASEKPQILVYDGTTGELLSENSYKRAYRPRELVSLSNHGGTPADEIAIVGRRVSNLRTRLQVIDSKSLRVLRTLSVPPSENPIALTSLPSQASTGADDLVMLTNRPNDGTLRAFYKDGRGSHVKTLVVGEEVALGRVSKIIAFGDSITAGVGDDSGSDDPGWPSRLEQLLRDADRDVEVVNRGTGAQSTSEGLSAIDDVLAEGGDLIIIMEGTNDITRGISAETAAFNLRQMGNKARRRDFKVVHATVIPRWPPSRVDPENVTNQFMNELIRDVAGTSGADLADPFELWSYAPDRFRRLYADIGGDPVGHPNGVGYDFLAEIFRDVLLGVDTVHPVTGRYFPFNGQRRLRPRPSIEVDLWDFGSGINRSESFLLVDGDVVPAATERSSQRTIFTYTPPSDLSGVVTLGIRAQDRNDPVNAVDHTIGRFEIRGARFLAGDINRSGRVDGADLVLLALAHGSMAGQARFNAHADFNQDGSIDGADLAILASNFGMSA